MPAMRTTSCCGDEDVRASAGEERRGMSLTHYYNPHEGKRIKKERPSQAAARAENQFGYLGVVVVVLPLPFLLFLPPLWPFLPLVVVLVAAVFGATLPGGS